MDLAVARGERPTPTWVDPAAAILQQRGLEHEGAYANALRAAGLRVIDLSSVPLEDGPARSFDAMRAGAEVILQPALRHNDWFGRPDVLRRVDLPSSLGPWSYEVMDTKLARETGGATVLQLSIYSELLGIAQAALPEAFHVVTPDPERPVQTFRVLDFSAYVRLVRAQLEMTVRQESSSITDANYPEPVEHCSVCRWWSVCDQRRRQDDHLSLVAGLRRLHSRELQANGVTTLAGLGTLPIPLPFKPRRGALETYVHLRDQARVQLEGRTQGQPVHELLAIVPDQGLARLPVPSVGDIFLDLEGDPFARQGGREYLFGLVTVTSDGLRARAFWAHSDEEERTAFERVIDEILRTLAANPGMHVYHYSPYEPAALRRLMGRHASREKEVDRLLRAELFVDLFAIVRHSLRASVESYSIKDLEPFYGFARAVHLAAARTNLRIVEHALEFDDPKAITEKVRVAVEGYNREDCLSALGLRDWLEHLRSEVELNGTPVPRPAPKAGEASERIKDRERRVQALATALMAGVPSERRARNEEQQACWLLANLLDWHRREAKAPAWEFFRLRDLAEEELLAEKDALAGLTFLERVGGTKKCPIDRYSFPAQDTEVRQEDELHLPDGTNFGDVEGIDRVARTIDIRKRNAQADVHPSAVFAHTVINTDVLADALLRIGDDIVQHGTRGTRFRAASELLLRNRPRIRDDEFKTHHGETPVGFAVRIAPALEDTVLPIQGPPGAGKTFTGARMICELVRRGASVGVTAVSHKVIRKLLDEVVVAAGELCLPVNCLHKVKTKSNSSGPGVEEAVKNEDALSRLANGRAQVLGGTQFLWARPDARVDVLFVDEAAQMSLANVLAASQAASSVVLLGDPQQLEQPQQGAHPEGTDCSALEHLLGDHKTIPDDRGIFLRETWRLPPSICAFTSEVFYEGRLQALPGLERQRLVGVGPFEGAGLWVVGVPHEGNQSSSREEVEVIERIVASLLRPEAQWIDREYVARRMTPQDILVVAPYNSQVSLLGERLESQGVRVGSVDRFQGQQAPVVVYSMASSTPEDAPRGMDFLYSLNRLNVATSRARCACILVASPRLFEPECKSPRQMRLANALCRYIELAQTVIL